MKVKPLLLGAISLMLSITAQAHPNHEQALAMIDANAPAAEIEPLLEQAAADGHTPAMAYLGWWYETGQNGAQDGEKAAEWYGAAAEQGALEYALKLGWMYLKGDVLPRDRTLAEYWFGYAQQRNYLAANVALGSVLVADALGGDSASALRARDVLIPAFIQGDVNAAYFLARLHREGIGEITANASTSFAYNLFGAMHGQAQMQGWLAQAYAQGEGTPQNSQAAAAWALLAVDGGDPQAEQLIEQIDTHFSDQQWLAAWIKANQLQQQIDAVLAACCA